MKFHLTAKSSNVKTGPMPVSITTADTCPNACSLKDGGCYAKSGPLAIHWKRTETQGVDLSEFCAKVNQLVDGSLWRHNQAGDLPGNGDYINTKALSMLVDANRGKRGFTYTHYDPRIADNATAIEDANDNGFTINLSAENLEQADEYAALSIGPVVPLLPIAQTETTVTPAGRKVVVCPATQRDDVSCMTCQLCQRQRNTIVGFPAHGTSKKKAQAIFFVKR